MRDVNGDVARDAGSRLVGRVMLSFGLAGLFLWLLSTRLAAVDPGAVGAALAGVNGLQWGLAVTATAISFWAIGHYDAVVHRHLATGFPDATARRAGISAIAVSQMLGLGVITGAALRWRMLPGQSWAMATKLTVAVALSFLVGWAVVTATVALILPAAPFRSLAALGMLLAGAGVAAKLGWPGRTRSWPNLFTQARLVGLAAVDTIAAALALYCLLPAELGLPLITLLPVFLIAQGAGMVSGAPGGVGAFEVTLLALLPPLPQDPLLAAVLAWRITYYALPAALGAIIAVIGPRPLREPRSDPRLQPEPVRAETLLELQGEHHRLASGDWLAARTSHLLVGMFDPMGPVHKALSGLRDAADREDRWPAIYKCGGRMAAVARGAGWQVMAVAREAWLDPRRFRLGTASRAGLRRKMRRAEAAGLQVCHASHLPIAAMGRIAADWARRHGGERGFSMGRFAPGYVARQRVYLAHCGPDLVGFATFHEGRTEWTLDLMRQGSAAPDGTMHALVAAAIADAARAGLPRLSLAAVPEAAFGQARKMGRVLRRFGCDGAGLLRFKATFAPRWQPLYLAAPHALALGVAGVEIARAIAAPPPLRETEQDHAEYAFASARPAWHRRAN